MGLPWSLPRLVGAGKARELSLLPRKLTADEAAAIGLVNAAFDDDMFRAEVRGASSTRLAGAAPLARRGMKAHYVAAESMGFGEFIAIETKAHGAITASEDCSEAFSAFVEKRTPRSRGSDRHAQTPPDRPRRPTTTSSPPRSSSTSSASPSASTTRTSSASGCTTR